MGEKKEEEKRGPGLKNLTFYDPANPPYETHHVCILLGELDREAEENGPSGPMPSVEGGTDCERSGKKPVD